MDGKEPLARLREGLFGVIWTDAIAASNGVADTLVALSRDRELLEAPAPLEKLPLRITHGVGDALHGGSRASDRPGDRLPTAGVPAQEIVAQTQRALGLVKGNSIALVDLAFDVAKATGYNELSVRAVILRNFVSDGRVVQK